MTLRLLTFAAVSGTLAATAAAEPIRYDYPLGPDPDIPGWVLGGDSPFDITLPPGTNPSTHGLLPSLFFSLDNEGHVSGQDSPRNGLSTSGGQLTVGKGLLVSGSSTNSGLTLPLAFGESISDSSGTYAREGNYYTGNRSSLYDDDGEFIGWGWNRLTTDLPFYESVYIGVRFGIEEHRTITKHFGWIELYMTGVHPTSDTPFAPRPTITITAWGYETEPDTPILAGIPAPATFGLLGLGGMVAARRRR